MNTDPMTYVAVTSTWWLTNDPDEVPLANRVYDILNPTVGGFVGIWTMIVGFSETLDKAFDWSETEFVDTVEEYVPEWQRLIIRHKRPVPFDEVHEYVKQRSEFRIVTYENI